MVKQTFQGGMRLEACRLSTYLAHTSHMYILAHSMHTNLISNARLSAAALQQCSLPIGHTRCSPITQVRTMSASQVATGCPASQGCCCEHREARTWVNVLVAALQCCQAMKRCTQCAMLLCFCQPRNILQRPRCSYVSSCCHCLNILQGECLFRFHSGLTDTTAG